MTDAHSRECCYNWRNEINILDIVIGAEHVVPPGNGKRQGQDYTAARL